MLSASLPTLSVAEPAALVANATALSQSTATVSAPTNVKAALVASTNQISISWNSSSGATSYSVYRSTVNNANGAVCIGSCVCGTSFVDKSPAVSTNYYYWVKAYKGSTASAFSAVAQCSDTDRNVSLTRQISATALLQVINFTQDLADDINAILKWDPAPKPSVSAALDCLCASETENVVETATGALVSGTTQISVSESGHVTAQYTAGIPYIASAGLGVTVYESCSLSIVESYNPSSGWVVNPACTSVRGTVSATGTGVTTVGGYTGEIDLKVPATAFSATGSGVVSIKPNVSINVGYQVTGHGVNKSGTLYQSASLALPSWTFNLNRLPL